MKTYKGKHRTFLSILAVMTAAVGVVAILSWVYVDPAYNNNGFSRKMENMQLKLVNAIPKEGGIILVCDIDPQHLYFKTRVPGLIVQTDYDLNNQKILKYNVPRNTTIQSSFSCFINGKNLNMVSGNLPGEIIGSTDGAPVINKFKTAVFTRVERIPGNSYVFRGFDSTLKSVDQIFHKVNTSGIIYKENNISKKYNDAGISTDGMLHYDSKTNLLTYVYYYGNKFIVMDTNLNLIRTNNTIDTTTVFQVTADGVQSTEQLKTFTNVTPKQTINASNCVWNGKLYNYSTLKAENESKESFSNNSPIDVYDIKTGKYEYSFYIPAYKSERSKHFKVVDNQLIALYKTNIVCYQLNH